MWSNEIHLALKNVVEIHHQEERRNTDSSLEDAAAAPQGSEFNLGQILLLEWCKYLCVLLGIGGFFRDGSLGWNARGSLFEVFCTKSGVKLVSHCFDQDSK